MSTIKVDTIQDAGGVEQFTIKAWCNWQNETNITIRGSGGVSSITDLSTGKTVLTLNNAAGDVYYHVNFSGSETDTDGAQMFMCQALTTTTQEYQCDNGGGSPDNLNNNMATVGY